MIKLIIKNQIFFLKQKYFTGVKYIKYVRYARYARYARYVTTGIFIILSFFSEANAKTQIYHPFPTQYLPSSPTQHPRIYLQGRLPALRKLFQTTPKIPAVLAFQHDIDKLLSYTSACQDWRCENGWPAAALALHWLITGNTESGRKACEIFIPHFTGQASHTQMTDLYYSLAYDWLFHHPCFTNVRKADLRQKLITWSDQTAASDEAGSWIAHDSDHNIATTAGHFIGGLAMLGEDQKNGLKLLKRGWTGWKYGLNASDQLPDFPVSKFFRASLDTGIPLPGWDYGMMSDVHMAQNLYYILDELGVIEAEFADLKPWWINSLKFFMHSVDPANSHYHWIGDQQSTVDLSEGGGKYIWSYLSNCVFLAQRYGYLTEAALGRSFLDFLKRPSYGISEGDTMLWFMTAWADSAKRIDFTVKSPRYVLAGLGSSQHMGLGAFRSAWTSSAESSDPQQVTWGGFYGIGSYIVDHMHNSAGSFWLWRNGEYLLTEPLNYGGNEAAITPFTLWNSLSIPNEAVPNSNELYDNGGPVVYFNAGSAYLARGRADEKHKVFYALLNADHSYNVPDNPWATCTGTCRQPVKQYTRSFAYDESTQVIFLLDRVDLARLRPVGLRFRTQQPLELATAIDQTTVAVPSELGNYRTLIRVLQPKLAQSWEIAPEPWAATVPNWQIKTSMIGSQVHQTFANALRHRILTILQLDHTEAANNVLQNASVITAASGSIGACAKSFCFIGSDANIKNPIRSSLQYTTPAMMPANSRHLVADLAAGNNYTVISSSSGTIVNEQVVAVDDYTLWFVVPTAGVQVISINKK